jgi:hypothetical protein
MQAPAPGVVVLRCDPEWDDCQKKQAKAKAAKLNKKCPLTRKGGISQADDTLSVSLRDLGNDSAQAFKKSFKRVLSGKPPYKYSWLPSIDKHPQYHPRGNDSDYADPCMKDKLDKGKIPKRPNRKNQDGWQADHIVDMQWGGNSRGPMWMMDADVNESLGRQMTQAPNNEVTEATEFKTEGC